jgi:hypothetical protein
LGLDHAHSDIIVTPTHLRAIMNVESLSIGAFHGLALTSKLVCHNSHVSDDGRVFTWGGFEKRLVHEIQSLSNLGIAGIAGGAGFSMAWTSMLYLNNRLTM